MVGGGSYVEYQNLQQNAMVSILNLFGYSKNLMIVFI